MTTIIVKSRRRTVFAPLRAATIPGNPPPAPSSITFRFWYISGWASRYVAKALAALYLAHRTNQLLI